MNLKELAEKLKDKLFARKPILRLISENSHVLGQPFQETVYQTRFAAALVAYQSNTHGMAVLPVPVGLFQLLKLVVAPNEHSLFLKRCRR